MNKHQCQNSGNSLCFKEIKKHFLLFLLIQTLAASACLELAFGAGLDFDLFLMASCPDEKGEVILRTSPARRAGAAGAARHNISPARGRDAPEAFCL